MILCTGMAHSGSEVCSQHQTWDVIYIKTAPALKGTAGNASEGSLKTRVSLHTCHEHLSCVSGVSRDPVERRHHRTGFSEGTPNKTFCNTVGPQLVPPGGSAPRIRGCCRFLSEGLGPQGTQVLLLCVFLQRCSWRRGEAPPGGRRPLGRTPPQSFGLWCCSAWIC